MADIPPSAGSSKSKDTSPEQTLAQPIRYKSACESCHASKVKCTGKQPCARCSTNGWECVYKFAARIGKPKGSRNKSTLRRLQMEAEQAVREGRTSPATSISGGLSSPFQTPSAGSVESATAVFTPPYTSSTLPSGSEHQEWMWPQGANPWTQNAENLHSAPLLSHTVPASDSQWPSGMMEVARSGSTGSAIDATTTGEGLGISDWNPAYSIHEDSQGMPASCGVQSVYSGLQTMGYTLPDMPANPYSAVPTGYASQPTLGSTFTGSSNDSPQSAPGPWTSTEHTPVLLPQRHSMSPVVCHCQRNMSWQLRRLDQLRNSMTPTTTVGGFLNESIELRHAAAFYLACPNCAKGAAGLCLMTKAFANFTHVLLLIVRKGMDPVAQCMRDGNYNWLSMIPADAAGLTPDQLGVRKMEAKVMIDHWTEACERALQIVGALSVPVGGGAAGMAQTHEGAASGKISAAAISWSASDPSSVGEMLWRVKQSLTNLV